MRFNKEFVIDFASFYRTGDAPIYEAFDAFLGKYLKEAEKPEPGIYLQVLQTAAEMCNVTMDELSGGRKYGEIPTCKQMASKILHELKCSEESIAKELPVMGVRGTVHSQIMAASKYENSEPSYKVVMMQLRERFGIEAPVR